MAKAARLRSPRLCAKPRPRDPVCRHDLTRSINPIILAERRSVSRIRSIDHALHVEVGLFSNSLSGDILDNLEIFYFNWYLVWSVPQVTTTVRVVHPLIRLTRLLHFRVFLILVTSFHIPRRRILCHLDDPSNLLRSIS